MPETPLEGATVVAEKIRKRVENHGIELDNGETLHFTVSLGVSQTETMHDPNIEATIQRADNALYAAKNAGRNMLTFIAPPSQHG